MAVAGGRVTHGVGSNLIGIHSQARNQEATLYVGNLDTRVTEDILWVRSPRSDGCRAADALICSRRHTPRGRRAQELFIQAGPVTSVYVPKDRVTNENNGFGFVEMKTERDADYAAKVGKRGSPQADEGGGGADQLASRRCQSPPTPPPPAAGHEYDQAV